MQGPVGWRRDIEVLRTSHGQATSGREFHQLELRVPPELIYFQGHFAGDPVLPGVVQLHTMVLPQVEMAWPALAGLREVRRLKFVHIIRPGDSLRLRLERAPAAAQVSFSLWRGTACCTSGSMVFDSEATR